MARPINEVLTQPELEKIELIESSIYDLSQAKIVPNIGHIACDLYTTKEGNEIVQARFYINPRGVYNNLMQRLNLNRKSSKIARWAYTKKKDDLFSIRKEHFVEFKGRKHEIKAFEAKLRGQEIEANRYYIRERYIHELAGRDPGLFVAAAHWVSEYSDEFCKLAQEHYISLGITDFSLVGLERAVVISAPEKKGVFSSYVIAMSADLSAEEKCAQTLSGLLKFSGDNDNYSTKAKLLRQKLEEIEAGNHFCILGTKGI